MQTSTCTGREGKVDAVDSGELVDGDARPECEPAVVAARAEGGHDVLRAIIDGVRIRGARQRRRRGVGSAAHRLMIYAGGLARALRARPVVPVVVSERQLAGDAVELRREGPVRAAEMAGVGEEGRGGAEARERPPLVLPTPRAALHDAVPAPP